MMDFNQWLAYHNQKKEEPLSVVTLDSLEESKRRKLYQLIKQAV